MSAKRRDNRNRILNRGESQRKDGIRSVRFAAVTGITGSYAYSRKKKSNR